MEHEFNFATMGMVESLALMLQGKMEPKVWNANEHMDLNGRIQHYKKEVLDRVNSQVTYAADTISRYRNSSLENLKAAKRRYQQSRDRLPTDLNEPLFEIWKTFLEDSIDEIDYQISQKEPAPIPERTVRDDIKRIVEMISNLERDRDEEIRKNPEQADLIRKIYRQAVDRIREQQ